MERVSLICHMERVSLIGLIITERGHIERVSLIGHGSLSIFSIEDRSKRSYVETLYGDLSWIGLI